MNRMRIMGLVLLVGLVASCQHAGRYEQKEIVFRQHELETLWQNEWQASRIEVDSNDPQKVLNEIFKRLPDICKVYPTEGYYYFKANLLDGVFSGNFRVAVDPDSERLLLNFAYFDIHEPRKFKSLALFNGEGVNITPLSDDQYKVVVGQNTKVFNDAGRAYRNAAGQIELDSDEELVTGVMDESGVWFSLVFNRETRYFYYIRNLKSPSADQWVVVEDLGKYRILLGVASGFVFLQDIASRRELLVGVRRLEVQRNTFYDGPFDQVPPDLDIADMLRAAYPYVDAGLGIDKHGGFVEKKNMRVAISPYQVYSKIDDVINLCKTAIDRCDSFECIHEIVCYETKRDYHTNQNGSSDALRRKWPANHYRTVSYSWQE